MGGFSLSLSLLSLPHSLLPFYPWRLGISFRLYVYAASAEYYIYVYIKPRSKTYRDAPFFALCAVGKRESHRRPVVVLVDRLSRENSKLIFFRRTRLLYESKVK